MDSSHLFAVEKLNPALMYLSASEIDNKESIMKRMDAYAFF